MLLGSCYCSICVYPTIEASMEPNEDNTAELNLGQLYTAQMLMQVIGNTDKVQIVLAHHGDTCAAYVSIPTPGGESAMVIAKLVDPLAGHQFGIGARVIVNTDANPLTPRDVRIVTGRRVGRLLTAHPEVADFSRKMSSIQLSGDARFVTYVGDA